MQTHTFQLSGYSFSLSFLLVFSNQFGISAHFGLDCIEPLYVSFRWDWFAEAPENLTRSSIQPWAWEIATWFFFYFIYFLMREMSKSIKWTLHELDALRVGPLYALKTVSFSWSQLFQLSVRLKTRAAVVCSLKNLKV